MATMRANSRLQVGTSAWIAEERNSALQIVDAEVEEFTFSARNEFDWLNEHMAEIFNENQINVAEIFKTPGKLRGKTPRTARKRNPLESRAPLSDIFSATPKATFSPLRQVDVPRQAPQFQVAEDEVQAPKAILPPPKATGARAAEVINFDSGYHGSQASVATEVDDTLRNQHVSKPSPEKSATEDDDTAKDISESDERRTTEGSYQSAREEQTVPVTFEDVLAKRAVPTIPAAQPRNIKALQSPSPSRAIKSPVPAKASPVKAAPVVPQPEKASEPATKTDKDGDVVFEDAESQSDGSSPIAPIVRKSSINFASLPAREPLTATKKSIGNRTSRTSHFGKSAPGKSLGNKEHDEDEMDVDVEETRPNNEESDADSKAKQIHNKTYTQRLQDQISKLGQSQANGPRPSKSIPNISALQSQPQYPTLPTAARQPQSPAHVDRQRPAPGAFPDDEDDDWIGPPTVPGGASSIFSPRPMLTKSYSTDVMDGIHGVDSIGGSEFNVPKHRTQEPRQRSPFREAHPEDGLGLTKSISAPVIDSPRKGDDLELGLKKGISVSNPNLASARKIQPSTTPSKSPSRSYRDSPLKAAKEKLSSILKTSKGLFASSAAASATAMASLSPAPARLGQHAGASLEDLSQPQRVDNQQLYTSLSTHAEKQMQSQMDSPSKKPSVRKAKDKEAKDAQVMADQLDKLGKEREREAEKARIFSQQERERVAAMERQVAAQKEQEKQARMVQAPQKATRTSPRKNKAQLEAEGRAAAGPSNSNVDALGNVEMVDASSMPPPQVPRTTTTSQLGKPREQIKRPIKPTKEPLSKPKQAPVVIRVNTGSRPFQPSTVALSASLQDSLGPPTQSNTGSASTATVAATGPPKPKVGSRPLHTKPSTDSMRSFASSTTGKVKALEAAARKKEQDEREAQRKREAKIELANQLDAKKNAQRALEKKQQLEKAKQERPPPPAPRPNPTAEHDHAVPQEKPSSSQQRNDLAQSKPVNRMNSAVHRQPEEPRLGASIHNAAKALPKRPLAGEEQPSRPTLLRNGPSYQQNEHKRRKTGEEHNEETTEPQPKAPMVPPIRQSAIRQKDGPTKSLFPNGYTSASQASHGLTHKATHPVPPHMHAAKPSHPLDMVQNSKAPISFAPNSSHTATAAHKTPARPAGPVNAGGKSTSKKSSPRYQNGENIELPEIHTDSEDEDSDGGNDFAVPDWANSPNLNMNLMAQEGQDPTAVFGPPGELKMEEVFKNKERWNRFRSRTSSANWTGNDRLTEEEIQRDLLARERLRREGGWSYGMSFGS